MKAVGALALATMTIVPAIARAQATGTTQPVLADRRWTFSAFEDRPWFRPMAANPRDSQTQVLAFGLSNPSEYMTRSGAHRIWDVTLGEELPLLVLDPGAAERMPKGRWGFGLWLPVDSHFVLDFTEAQQPITNNGYHVALAGKAARGLTDRDQLLMKIEVEHESDHMSDEAVLNAQERYGDRFRRIDVNYQSLELGVSWDRQLRSGTATHRFSMLWTLDSWGHPGFYSAGVPGHDNVLPSRRNYEPAYGFEYMPSAEHGMRPFFSFDTRLRTVFNYSKQSPAQKESSQLSSAVVVGVRDLGHKNTPDLILRAYYGANPNGQFGKQNDYRSIGIGFRLR